MKINSLLESQTPSSAIANTTSSAPEFGRDEDKLEETTTSGSVATVASPIGKVQSRGSIFSGIKTSEKFPNSKKVKEAQLDEVNPQNYDSDEDYYNAVKKQGQQQFSGDWDVYDEIASLENQIKYTKSSALAHTLYQKIDQLKQQAGIEDEEDEYEKEYDADIKARKGIAEQDLIEKSKSKAQFRMMAAVANNPEFAKKVGIKQSVGKEFHKADKKQDYKDLPKEVDEGFSDMMAKERKKRLAAAEKKKQERLAKEKENKKNKEQGVAEMDGNGSGRDGSNRKRIGSYGSRDRDITGPDVHLGSDSMIASKDMQDRALDKLTKMLSEPENMKVLKRLKTKEGVAEGWDPDTTRLEQDVRDALENGDDYTAKQYAKMAPTPEAKKYLLNIIKQAMYLDDLGGETDWKGVAEGRKEDEEQYRQQSDQAWDKVYSQAKGPVSRFATKVAAKLDGSKRKLGQNKEQGVAEGTETGPYKVMGGEDGYYIVGPGRKLNSGACYYDSQDAHEACATLNKRYTQQGVAESEKNPFEKGSMGHALWRDLSKQKKLSPQQIQRNKDRWAHRQMPKGGYSDESHPIKDDGNEGRSGKQNYPGMKEEKQRLDPKCWKGYKKQGTKMKGDTRVNNCVKVDEAEFTEDKLAQDLYKDLQIFKKGADKDIGQKAKDKDIGNKPKDKDIVTKESFNGEYDDEAGSAESNLLTTARAVKGLLDTIEDRDNLPEWVQEKIAKAEGMLVATWDYLQSQKEQGIDPQIAEDWQKANKSDKTDGMSTKAVKAYRRENPGSKLKTAVTKKPSEIKKGSSDDKRRKSFCARSNGQRKMHNIDCSKTPDKAICKARKRWNC